MTTAHVYTKFADSLAEKKANLTTDTLKVMLLSAYTVGSTQDTAQYLSDVLAVATEATGTGYTAGGQALSSVTWTASGHVYTLDAADTVWTSSTITAAYAVIYDSTPGTNATNPVIGYLDFGASIPSTSGSYTITWNASGILTVTGS